MKTLRTIVVGVALTGALAITSSAEARHCHRRPVLGAPLRIVARVAERRPLRRIAAAPLRLVVRGRCCP